MGVTMGQDGERRPALGTLGLLMVVLGVFMGTGRISGDGGDAPSSDAPPKGGTSAEKSSDKVGGAAARGDAVNDYRRPYLEFRGGIEEGTVAVPPGKENLSTSRMNDFGESSHNRFGYISFG
jgi:hypothetical protein